MNSSTDDVMMKLINSEDVEVRFTEERLSYINNMFTVWDYLVFVGVLAISSVIGIYYACSGSKQSTTGEFLLAGRSMSIFPVAMSLLASFMSAIALLGFPAEMTIFGTQYWMIAIAYALVIPISNYWFIPVFYRLRLTSIFEYLEMRFNKTVRVYASVIYVVQMVIYLALVLYAPCLALSVVTGLNKWIAVLSVGLVCTFYTTIGGMKAVMWTDVVQIFLMFAGMICVIVKGCIDHGGPTGLWNIMKEGERIEFFDFDPDPLKRHSFWILVIGGTTNWLMVYGVSQAQVQRALCTPSLRHAQLAMWINVPGLILLLSVCCFCGTVLYAEYRFCNPITLGRITSKDQLMPLYVMDKMSYPGLPGLFTASIFSGALRMIILFEALYLDGNVIYLSTISSVLNSLAAVCSEDLLRGLCWKKMTEHQAILASKIISVVFGVVMILMTFVASQLGGVLQAAMSVFGMISGPVLGLFILGLFYPCANNKGALAGVTTSLVLTIWLGVGAHIYQPAIKGHVVPPMNTVNCPRINVTHVFNMTATLSSRATMLSDTSVMSSSWQQADVTTLTSASDKPGYMSFYQLSYLWYSTFAVVVATTTGLVVSFLTGYTKSSELKDGVLSPALAVFTPCLPQSLRLYLDLHISQSRSRCKEKDCKQRQQQQQQQQQQPQQQQPQPQQQHIQHQPIQKSSPLVSENGHRVTIANKFNISDQSQENVQLRPDQTLLQLIEVQTKL